jgi:hypothetical protein
MISTITGAQAAIEGIKALKNNPLTVTSLQEYGERVEKTISHKTAQASPIAT